MLDRSDKQWRNGVSENPCLEVNGPENENKVMH